MSIYEDIFTRLSGFAGLTALVSTRIYPVRIPQNKALPSVVYSTVNENRTSAFGDDTGDVEARIQFDAYGKTFQAADAVAEQVRLAMQRYDGGSIQDVYIDSRRTDFNDRPDLYRVSLDLIIWYKE